MLEIRIKHPLHLFVSFCLFLSFSDVVLINMNAFSKKKKKKVGGFKSMTVLKYYTKPMLQEWYLTGQNKYPRLQLISLVSDQYVDSNGCIITSGYSNTSSQINDVNDLCDLYYEHFQQSERPAINVVAN